jgi:hypothetical protein
VIDVATIKQAPVAPIQSADDEKRAVVSRLESLNAVCSCQCCGNVDRFTFMDGYVYMSIQQGCAGSARTSLPCAAIVCNVCGYVRLHAVEVLGVGVNRLS